MTTLAIGSSVTLSVGDGGSFNLSTGGGLASVTVTPTVGAVSVVNLGALAERRTIGPFAEGASVVVANISCASLDYDYSAGSGLNIGQVAAVQGLVSGAAVTAADSSTATAVANRANINAALATYGLAYVPALLGIVWYSGSIIMPSSSLLSIGTGTDLKHIDGRSQPAVKNKYCGHVHSSALFVRTLSTTATVTDTGHSRYVGEQLFISGGPDASYIGLVSIATTTANSWSYASAGANSTAGTVGQYFNIIPVRRTIDASLCVATAFYVTVQDVGHSLRVGQQIYIGQVGGSNFAPGIVKVARASKNTWTYKTTAATGTGSGTLALSYDRSITITGGGKLNGNRLGSNGAFDNGNDMLMSAGFFGCVTGLYLDCAIGGSFIRGVSGFNCADVQLRSNFYGFDALVTAQFEGGVDGFICDQAAPGASSLENATPLAVTVVSATRGGAGNLTATITTALPHGIDDGSWCTTTGFTPAQFNRQVAVKVTGPSSYTFLMTSAPASDATVQGTYVVGQQMDDYIAFTGVKFANGAAGNYDSTISPYGLTYFSGIDVRRAYPVNCLNGIKLTADSTCPFIGVTRIGAVIARQLDNTPGKSQNSAVMVFDDGPGLVATKIETLQLDGPFEWTTPAGSTSGGITLQGAGTVEAVIARSINGVVGPTALVYVGGMTIDLLDISDSKFPALGAGKPAFQLLGGTIRKLKIRNSRPVIGASQTLVYISGATVNDIEVESMLINSLATGAGDLIQYVAAGGLRSITFRGIRNKQSGNAFGSLLSIGDIAVGTLDIYLDDCDFQSANGITAPGTGATGTINLHVSKRTRWAPSGGNNFAQFGGGTVSVIGDYGCVIPADKLALFGYGSPTYRLHMPSSTAGVNINGANYSGAQVVPVNGDQLFNNNAGVLAIGPVVRRAGVWAAL